MEFQEIVWAELIANDISLCTGCDSYNSHSRGFAMVSDRTIHYSMKCATRSTLHGFLHEVGHIVLAHGKHCQLKRWQKEQQAEDFATRSLKSYGIPVPRKTVNLGKRYVARWKRKIRKSSGRRLYNGK